MRNELARAVQAERKRRVARIKRAAKLMIRSIDQMTNTSLWLVETIAMAALGRSVSAKKRKKP